MKQPRFILTLVALGAIFGFQSYAKAQAALVTIVRPHLVRAVIAVGATVFGYQAASAHQERTNQRNDNQSDR